MLEFHILGPLEVLDDGRQLALGGAKQRALLAILLLHCRERISTDQLIDQLWDGQAPATAAKTVQVYVSHLRKAIGPELLVTRGSGYLLEAGPDHVDADRFAALAAEARAALQAGDPERAGHALREALALWRGPPLADFTYEPFAQTEIARLEEARLTALEDRIDAELALGNHATAVGELEALVREHPLRERLYLQLMLALYRSGRQAEALEHYRKARRVLNEELGLEPGTELQDLERQILAQDPALAAPAQPTLAERLAERGRVNRGLVLLAAGGVALAALAILVAVLSSGGGTGVTVAPNSVAVLDAADGGAVADIPVGTRPGAIAAGEGSVWVANVGDGSVSQIRPRTRRVISTTAPGGADGLAAGADAVWVSDAARSILTRLDPEFQSVAARIAFGRPSGPGPFPKPVAAGSGAIWVGDGESARVVRIDPDTNDLVARVDLGNEPVAIAVGPSGVWVADDVDNTVSRIDPASANTVTTTIPVGQGSSAIAVGQGAVWVTNTQEGTVARIDAETGSVVATIPVGGRPTGIAVGAGSVWVANSLDGTVARIDPETNGVVETTKLGQSPQSLVVARGSVWVTVQAKPPAAFQQSAAGETLRVLLTEDTGSPDPALYNGDTQRAYATCALLYNYPDQPFPDGSRMEPEVAKGSPAISDGGRTYTFTLRRGFRFSPPSGERVTAASFEREIDRVLSPKLNAFPGSFMGDIVGAKAYMSGRARELAGVSANGNRLVVRLVSPAPDLPSRLATPWFCAVPSNTPFTTKGTALIPTAGRYYTASYVPGKSMVLRRNPNYGGQYPSNFDAIQYDIGTAPADGVADVEAGHADYYGPSAVSSTTGVPPHVQRLERRYGPHSPAARAGRQQYFVEPQLSVYSLLFNTHRPPFDDPRLRRAVNFALDRRALAREPIAGSTGRAADQYIPPGVPGFHDFPIYPLGGPDLKRARRLARGVHAHVVLLACNLAPCARFGQIVRANLAAIGLDVEVHGYPFPKLFREIQKPDPTFDLAQYGYLVDNPDPYDFINLQFQSGVALQDLFDDPGFNRRMAAAAQLTGARRYRTYARLDRDLAAKAAPAAAYANGTTTNFFSSRVGCQMNQPIYGIDLGRLCVRK